MSKDRTWAVTGQNGREPLIFTWDSVTGEKKSRTILNSGARGINALSISACGKYFSAVDQSDSHCVYVYDAVSGNQLFC